MDAEDRAKLEAGEQRMLDTPMPDELHVAVANYIEPHVMNLGIKHRDVFEGIEFAYPLILDYLREHPEVLRG